MRALTFNGIRTIGFETVAEPIIESPTDVLVKVEFTAVCGSDLHVYHGREAGLDHGTVMGHEFVGEVVETGRDVRAVTQGTRVLSPFTTSCGRCYYCARGLTARCDSGQLFGWVQEGRGLHGGQAEYVRVPLADGTLVPIPEDVTPEEGLLLGDVLSTGYYCAKQADIVPGGCYVVVGCGPVGLLAVVAAKELGAETLFAVDLVPERLELARQYGATPLNLSSADVAAEVREATDGRGADGVLEVVGNESAHRLAADLVRPGGTISVVGVHNEAQFAFTPAEAYDRKLTYRVGRCPARAVLEEVIPIVQSHRHDLGAVISHRMDLSDGARGYDIFDRKLDDCTKVVLRT
jgi:threonine dehydrogenase-like Zn-dependent dehydrogenase